MLKILAKSVLGQFAGLGLFAGGFWLLFEAFQNGNVLLGLLGGVMMIVGMWFMAQARRIQSESTKENGQAGPGADGGQP